MRVCTSRDMFQVEGASRAAGRVQVSHQVQGSAPLCQGWQIYSSTQEAAIPNPWLLLLMEPTLGKGSSTWDAHLQPSSPGTPAVTVPRGGCHQPGGDRQHLVTSTCRSAFLNDELCLSVPSINSAVPAH